MADSPTASLSQQFIKDFVALKLRPSFQLQRVLHQWEIVQSDLARERHRLLRSIPKGDPLSVNADLLTPLSSHNDEVLHTLALAYLFDSDRDHGYRNGPLKYFLKVVGQISGTTKTLANAAHRNLMERESRVVVVPERRHLLSKFSSGKVSRSDLWIEIHSRHGAQLIVIENKINSPESDRQLSNYSKEARRWCRNERTQKAPLLIYLSPDGRSPESCAPGTWVPVAYPILACSLRKVWLRYRSAPGQAWMGMYINSLMRVAIEPWELHHGLANLPEIRTYLGLR